MIVKGALLSTLSRSVPNDSVDIRLKLCGHNKVFARHGDLPERCPVSPLSNMKA